MFCYFYNFTNKDIIQPQVQQMCEALHPSAHLLAINSQQEHDAVRAHITATDPACKLVWTGGKTDNPQGVTDNWYWDLRTVRQDITYCDWKATEPNNAASSGENTILLTAYDPANFAYTDAPEDMSAYALEPPWLCSLCEIDLF